MWEYSALRWIIENLQSPIVTEIMKIITLMGEGAGIFFLISIIMLFWKKTRKAAIVSIIALIFVSGFNNFVFKYLVARPRPFLHPELGGDALWLNNHVLAFGAESKFNDFLVPSSYAFASGHTLSAFLFGFIVAYYHKKAAVPVLVFSSIMAFTRLYFGFHYPTDVIAGIIWAFVASFALIATADRHEQDIVAWFKKKSSKKPKPVEEEV
jgi:undecaprenyl-diphosphatase